MIEPRAKSTRRASLKGSEKIKEQLSTPKKIKTSHNTSTKTKNRSTKKQKTQTKFDVEDSNENDKEDFMEIDHNGNNKPETFQSDQQTETKENQENQNYLRNGNDESNVDKKNSEQLSNDQEQNTVEDEVNGNEPNNVEAENTTVKNTENYTVNNISEENIKQEPEQKETESANKETESANGVEANGKELSNMIFVKQVENIKEISVVNTKGEYHKINELIGESEYLLVFVYPKAMTSGCTRQIKLFQESLDEFKNLKTTVIGLSGDNYTENLEFKNQHHLSYELCSDVDRKFLSFVGASSGMQTKRSVVIFNKDMEIVFKKINITPEQSKELSIDYLNQSTRSEQ